MKSNEQKLQLIESWFTQKGIDFQSGENTEGEQVFVADWNDKKFQIKWKNSLKTWILP